MVWTREENGGEQNSKNGYVEQADIEKKRVRPRRIWFDKIMEAMEKKE